MNRSWFSILLVSGLFGLLALLAILQYSWLGQISQSEKEQMQKRLQIDTENFTNDFNRTIQAAYFPFQLYADDWRQDFAIRYQNWHKNAELPDLIKDFYFVSSNGETLRYDFELEQFQPTDFAADFNRINDDFTPIDSQNFILRMPIYKSSEKIIETRRFIAESTVDLPLRVKQNLNLAARKTNLPEIYGYILIKLDETVIREKLLKNLTGKYFSGGNYHIAIVNESDNRAVFENPPFENPDASAKFFVLTPDDFSVFVNQDLLSSFSRSDSRKNSNSQKRVIFNQRIENHVITRQTSNTNTNYKVAVDNNEAPSFFHTGDLKSDGIWLLNVRHVAGSLDDFVAQTRNKNLAVSFGILSLLAVSVALIFLSAQRAKQFAQSQIDFVSAVSHEFRTPLAVIYSAGENLTDGVVQTEMQVARYGNLIKREGKKLSQMVEQILEFAGARSGRKKYDFRKIDVKNLIENVIKECQPLIEEKDYTVESDIAENLPPIMADNDALARAIQNLIVNSIKYGNGNHWVKISVKNGDGNVKITVEDKGIGISKKEILQIFQPFYRTKSVVDGQIHGSGLGLSLVKNTVEAHGGRVSVESDVGKGSRFTIHLPSII